MLHKFTFIITNPRRIQPPTPSPPKEIFCMNCLLIEMGEMACYQARCPQCNRIPPGRKIPSPEEQELARKYSIKLGRKYSLDIVKRNGGDQELNTSRARGNITQTMHPITGNLQPQVQQQKSIKWGEGQMEIKDSLA